jgi:succinoglycan biosynthesis transport protein ExoP
MKENQFDPLGQEPFADDEIDLSRWIQAFRRYWRLLAAITVAAIAVSVVKYVISPRLYRSTCTIQIERRTTGVVSVEDIFGGETFWDSQTFYPTQYKILESRGLAERVVKVLDLDQHPVFNPASALTDEAGDGAIEADSDLLLAGLANRLRGGLSIEPIRDTRMVSVSYTSTDPELAARIANGVAEEYINWGIENRSTTVSRAASFLDSQIEQIKREIQDKENQLQAYSRTTDIVALDPNSNVVIQRLRTLNENYTASVSNRIDKEAAYKGLLDAPEETVADTYSGGLVTDLRRKQLELEQEYATNLETYKPEWPQMKELEAKITTGRTNLQSVIDEMASEARKKARAEYQTALRREQSLAQELTQQKAEAMKVNSNAVEYRNLQVEIDTRRSLLDQLLRKQSDTGVADRLQGTRNSNVVVVDRALVPGGPFRPNLPRNVALGLVIGLFLGAGAVVLLELLDRTLRTPEDAERILNLPVLGVIPDVAEGATSGYGYGYGHGRKRRRSIRRFLSNRGTNDGKGSDGRHIELLPHRRPRLAASEAYRGVRTALLLSKAGGIRTLVVTSSTAREGKTSTTSNLATVLGQLGRKVLVVDADLRRPRIHEVFGISNRQGLVSVLAQGVDPAGLIVQTEVPNVWAIPAGATPPNPSELLSSSMMEHFATHVASSYDYVLYDTPPVAAVTDAVILGAMADGVVYTVAAGSVTRESALSGLERLQMSSIPVLGAVINRFVAESNRYDAYYYYQATYGDESEPASEPA